jgi:hypothetical protein
MLSPAHPMAAWPLPLEWVDDLSAAALLRQWLRVDVYPLEDSTRAVASVTVERAIELVRRDGQHDHFRGVLSFYVQHERLRDPTLAATVSEDAVQQAWNRWLTASVVDS